MEDSLSHTHTHTHTSWLAGYENYVSRAMCDTLGAVHYKGRKNGYDYFNIRRNVGSQNIRLVISESPIQDHFNYSNREELWRNIPIFGGKSLGPKPVIDIEMNEEDLPQNLVNDPFTFEALEYLRQSRPKTTKALEYLALSLFS